MRDRVAFISGGGSGIGQAAAIADRVRAHLEAVPKRLDRARLEMLGRRDEQPRIRAVIGVRSE